MSRLDAKGVKSDERLPWEVTSHLFYIVTILEVS